MDCPNLEETIQYSNTYMEVRVSAWLDYEACDGSQEKQSERKSPLGHPSGPGSFTLHLGQRGPGLGIVLLGNKSL